MAKKKTILFVTNCDNPKTIALYEQQTKNTYHRGDEERPCLTFLHSVPPHKVAQRAKEKRPSAVVFDGLSTQAVIQTIASIEKRFNGSLPSFLKIGTRHIIEKTSVHRTHEAAKEYLCQS